MKKRYYFAIIALFFGVLALYYYCFYDNLHTIIKGEIYRSRQLSEKKLQKVIDNKKIRSIINLRGINSGKKWFENEYKIAQQNNVTLYNINLTAYELPKHERLLKFISSLAEAKRPMLIHCRGGVDRTALASALVLALEQEVPLSLLKKQFSWIYRVIHFRNSAGPLFLSKYEKWLNNEGKKHNRANLLFWIKHVYIDGQGNIEYFIDAVSDHLSEESLFSIDRVFTLKETAQTIMINGWAFDPIGIAEVEDLCVVIDGQISNNLSRHNRPDVARAFSLGEKYEKRFMVGWSVQLDGDSLNTGCHRIFLRITNNKLIQYDISTRFRLCIKK